MRIMLLGLLALLLVAVTSASAPPADVQTTNDPTANAIVTQGALSQVLTLADPALQPPPIRPRVANLKRSYNPNADALITKFLGGRQTLIGNGDAIVNPIWGKGTRYKSGTVVYALPKDQSAARVRDLSQFPKLESVPAFLDVYPNGFLYTNNVSHKAVNAASPKVENGVLKPQYHNIFSEKDGQNAVEQMLPGMVGALTVPKGFRMRLTQQVQHYGERLYVYRVNSEYVTTYPVLDKNGKQVGDKPIAIPVLDSYVHVLLDGDKVLAGMEYFWDSQLSVDGSPKPCLQFAEADMAAQKWLINRYHGTPPLYTVNNVKLGYVQDRDNHNLLVPAWIFDASYITPLPSAVGTTENPVKRTNDPFAVNALTGKAFRLSNT